MTANFSSTKFEALERAKQYHGTHVTSGETEIQTGEGTCPDNLESQRQQPE